MFRLTIITLVAFLSFASFVRGHSWIACVDYTIENAQTWDSTKCRAYPRNFASHAGSGFGVDTGYNHQGDTCKYTMSTPASSAYTASFPMATYSTGQRVCLSWPSKNHVAATCTNPYIPDTSNEIYISGVDPSSDPATWTKIADFGANPSGKSLGQGGGLGYQNCPLFCENMDKSYCSQCFNIPANLTPGRYAFKWAWVFNAGTPAYTSCWDAIVVAGNGQAPTEPGAGASDYPTTANSVNEVVSLTGDAIMIREPPTHIDQGTTEITVSVSYSATMPVDIVVDLLKVPSYEWFGKGIQTNVPAGTGTIDLTITIQNSPTIGNYVIKPWIVEAGKGADPADEGWLYELDRKEYAVPIVEPGTFKSNDSARSYSAIYALILTILASIICFFF